MPVVRTDGRAGGRLVYGHAITKFSRMGSLPHFLTHGAPLRALRARELRYYFCYLQKLSMAQNNPCTKHLLGGQEMCFYWLKNSENSVHKLRLYATVLLTIYKISRQLFQTTKVRSAKHQFRIIKIHTWLHLHTPLSALNELLA